MARSDFASSLCSILSSCPSMGKFLVQRRDLLILGECYLGLGSWKISGRFLALIIMVLRNTSTLNCLRCFMVLGDWIKYHDTCLCIGLIYIPEQLLRVEVNFVICCTLPDTSIALKNGFSSVYPRLTNVLTVSPLYARTELIYGWKSITVNPYSP